VYNNPIMTIFTSEQHPDDPTHLPPARRRRAHRLLAPLEADDKATFLDALAHRASPSFDFFLFSLLSGLVIGIGFLLDAPVVLLFAALVAPLMSPVIGLSLGMITGSIPFFLRSLIGLVLGNTLILFCGFASGLVAKSLQFSGEASQVFSQAYSFAQLSWIHFLVLLTASAWLTATLVKNDPRRLLPNVALAYTLTLPVASAGFGLGAGLTHLWPDGLVVFTIHLAGSALTGAVLLALLGFRPLTLFGYTIGAAIALLSLILFIGLSGAGAAFGGRIALPTLTPSITPTRTLTPTVSTTPPPPTVTPTITPTSTQTPIPTPTVTPSATPYFLQIAAIGSDGILLRSDPAGQVLGSYVNGMIVQLYNEVTTADNVVWALIQTSDGKVGWVKRSLLIAPSVSPTP